MAPSSARAPVQHLGAPSGALAGGIPQIAGYAGKLDGESRKGNGVVAGVILLADEERLGGKRVTNALFLASSHFPTKEPLRTSSETLLSRGRASEAENRSALFLETRLSGGRASEAENHSALFLETLQFRSSA